MNYAKLTERVERLRIEASAAVARVVLFGMGVAANVGVAIYVNTRADAPKWADALPIGAAVLSMFAAGGSMLQGIQAGQELAALSAIQAEHEPSDQSADQGVPQPAN